MRFQSKDANFWDPELGKFDKEHSSFISTTLHDHHNLLVLFILVWRQNLLDFLNMYVKLIGILRT